MKKAFVLTALAVALLLSIASVASADSAQYGSGAPGTVTVSANVASKMTLTVTTPDAGQSIDYGAVDPGDVITGEAVQLNVKSNKAYDLDEAITAVAADELQVATDFTNVAGAAKTASQNYASNYTLTVPFDCAPGVHTATVVYTATQN
ncbi:MAG: hypothetical protein HGB10_11090 [Coriobacteriia bacterium]|nr:hypothetical protein [Coriobacteriia bacterium]